MRNSPDQAKRKYQEPDQIIRNIPDLIIRIDQSGRITFANAASILFFRKTPDLLIGKKLQKLVSDEHMTAIGTSAIERVFESGQAEIIEGELHSASGIDKHIEIRILPEPESALTKEPHLLLLIRDISRRKETERELIRAKRKAEESDILKSAFLANMSHEIRTPLNAIVGFSQIILDEGITREEQERFYEYINDNSNQLINLVNDIIDMSKLECNQLIIKESHCDLNELAGEMKLLAENEKKIRKKEHLMIILDAEFPADDGLILLDPFRLRQILTNLLVNAIKFTPKGYIQFGYRLMDPGKLLFYVRDTGIGIPLDKQGEIFQDFRQVDNSLNRGGNGSGLGLAICKRLIGLMQGTIWLQSEPGKGTTFFFSLPYVKASL
jgi:PAS domain S-box-containing protein